MIPYDSYKSRFPLLDFVTLGSAIIHFLRSIWCVSVRARACVLVCVGVYFTQVFFSFLIVVYDSYMYLS